MKKLLCLICAGIFTISAFSSINDQTFLVSTKGPDCYEDGTLVQDGEKYAVVWTKNNCAFEGFNSNGTIEGTNSSLIVTLPAKNHRLGRILLQISEKIARTDGTYSLYLLDTRVRDNNTGKYIVPSDNNSLTNIRSYVEMSSGFKYSQFAKLEDNDNQRTYFAATGYVEPPFIPTNGTSNTGINGNGEYEIGVWVGVYTNEVTITNVITDTKTEYRTITNAIDRITYRDVVRYVDVTNLVVMTNSFDVTNTIVNTINVTNTVDETQYIVKVVEKPVYSYVTITNYFDGIFGDVKEAIPTFKTNKKTAYIGLVLNNNVEVGTATIQIGKPNSYGLVKVSVKMKIGKKTYSDTLYGIIDDEGCVLAYGKDKNDRLIFNGKNLEGTVEYKGIVYEIDGIFNK